ncbi:MAG: glycosyltransferase family 2 protein [Caldisphaera sp.]
MTVVTTTYNEENTIGTLIRKIKEIDDKIFVIVVDDSSIDRTAQISKELADLTIVKKREGQTIGLYTGIKLAKTNIVLTIDADLENPPELIPYMINEFLNKRCDVLVASRNKLPRISEKFTSLIFKRIFGITDIYSNFRVFNKKCFTDDKIRLGETFGLELLIKTKKNNCRFCEIIYQSKYRRKNPRIGGIIRSNLRATVSTTKSLFGYYFVYR